MTRKDYEVIAKALNRSRPPHDGANDTNEAWAVWGRCVDVLARELGNHNPRFNFHYFVEACEKDQS